VKLFKLFQTLALIASLPSIAFGQPVDLVNGPKGAVALRVEAEQNAATSTKSEPASSCTEEPTVPIAIRRFNLERAYPEDAIRRGITGQLKIVVKVDEGGNVGDVVVVSAKPQGVFDAAVIAEARRMTFSPARRECKAVAADHEILIRFDLGG
jgi:TonB family protein